MLDEPAPSEHRPLQQYVPTPSEAQTQFVNIHGKSCAFMALSDSIRKANAKAMEP